METFARFLNFIFERDRSKWYTFSICDICLFLMTGVEWLVTGNSCIGFWLFIIGMNALATYFHNKED